MPYVNMVVPKNGIGKWCCYIGHYMRIQYKIFGYRIYIFRINKELERRMRHYKIRANQQKWIDSVKEDVIVRTDKKKLLQKEYVFVSGI